MRRFLRKYYTFPVALLCCLVFTISGIWGVAYLAHVLVIASWARIPAMITAIFLVVMCWFIPMLTHIKYGD